MNKTIGSLFSGVGGLDLAIESFFDAETVWHCEIEPEPSKVLAARWPGVPNLGDVTAVDWSQVEPVDILCGGFPCQDLSLAGRRSGMRPGTRSGLWADFKTAIAALNPKVVVIENVRGLLSGCAESDSDLEPCPGCLDITKQHRPLVRALGRVLGDLAALGFDAEWGALEASAVGAPHGRFRVFVVAYAKGVRFERGWPARGRRGGSADGDFGAPVALLPTPRAAASRSSRSAMTGPGMSGLSIEQAVEVAQGILPREFESWDEVRLLPTPQVADAEGGHATRSGERSNELLLPGLARAAQSGSLLPTPRASDGEHGGPNQRGSKGDLTVSSAVALLPTPRASRGAAATETMYALGAERTDDGDRQGNVVGEVHWGAYEPAVRRWEAFTRPAPAPTLPDGKNGAHRLSPRLPEWMMGYPAGWVTDVLDRNPAIKACGNGVVPQQAYAALGELWPRVLDALSEAMAA